METVIKSKIPGIQSLISKTISELETELSRLGKPIAADAGVSSIYFAFFFGPSVYHIQYLETSSVFIFMGYTMRGTHQELPENDYF